MRFVQLVLLNKSSVPELPLPQVQHGVIAVLKKLPASCFGQFD
jgi:hypothetical protein